MLNYTTGHSGYAPIAAKTNATAMKIEPQTKTYVSVLRPEVSYDR